jgi:hypothetical protein
MVLIDRPSAALDQKRRPMPQIKPASALFLYVKRFSMMPA